MGVFIKDQGIYNVFDWLLIHFSGHQMGGGGVYV